MTNLIHHEHEQRQLQEPFIVAYNREFHEKQAIEVVTRAFLTEVSTKACGFDYDTLRPWVEQQLRGCEELSVVVQCGAAVVAVFVVHDLAHELEVSFSEGCSVAELKDGLRVDLNDARFRDLAMMSPVLHLLTRWAIDNRRYVDSKMPSDDRVFGTVMDDEPLALDELRAAMAGRRGSWERLQPGEAVYLSLLAVHVDWQGRGLASRLMRGALDHVQKLGYERALIVSSSVGSQKIVSKLGALPCAQFVYRQFELFGMRFLDIDEPPCMKLSEFVLEPVAPRKESVLSAAAAWVWRLFGSAKTQLFAA